MVEMGGLAERDTVLELGDFAGKIGWLSWERYCIGGRWLC